MFFFFFFYNSRCKRQVMNVFMLRLCQCMCVFQVLAVGHRFLWLLFRQEAELCCGSISLLSLCFFCAEKGMQSVIHSRTNIYNTAGIEIFMLTQMVVFMPLFYQMELFYTSPKAVQLIYGWSFPQSSQIAANVFWKMWKLLWQK